jgi:hypothetical protein
MTILTKPKKKIAKSPIEVRRILTPAKGLRINRNGKARLDLNNAFQVLLTKKPSFHGHKEILFKGLCAWLQHSRNHFAARKAVAKETARQIAAAETEMAKKLGWKSAKDSSPPKGKIDDKKRAARQALTYLGTFSEKKYFPLYGQVYFHIGGMNAVTDAFTSIPMKKSGTGKKKKRPKHKSGIRHLVSVATILDFHYREFSSDREQFGRPSIDKAAKAAGKSPSQVNELLTEHRLAFALLYAADRVSVAENMSLLDLLLGKKPMQADIVAHLNEWLSYVIYFYDAVLTQMKGDWKKTYRPALPSIKPLQPVLLQLSEDDIIKIKNAFIEKKQSEAREHFK